MRGSSVAEKTQLPFVLSQASGTARSSWSTDLTDLNGTLAVSSLHM